MKSLYGLLLLGGIVLLATSGWFTDQHTVGLIMVILGGFWLLFSIVFMALIVALLAAADHPKRRAPR